MTTEWQTVVHSNNIQNLAIQPEQESAYEDWQKTVFTTASISGLLSYYFMIFVLLCQYSFLKPHYDNLKIWCKLRSSTGRILSPFEDSAEGDNSTCLNARQTIYFHVFFWLNLVLYSSTIVVFYIILSKVIGSSVA